MIKFLLIDKASTDVIVNQRTLQSVEYRQGTHLAKILKEKRLVSEAESPFSPDVQSVIEGNGLYFLSASDSVQNCLVLDFTQADPFGETDGARALSFFQRLLRCATRVWANMPLTTHEKRVANSNKIVVFPFPMHADNASFRVVMEKAGETQKRKEQGLGFVHLLVFKAGHEEGAGASEKPEWGVFNEAFAFLESAWKASKFQSKAQEHADTDSSLVLSVVELPAISSGKIRAYLNFQEWMPRLTRKQQEFVQESFIGPCRIQGPAGTGKTLCLVLKCIQTVRAAATQNEDYHVAFLVHSEATRRNLLAMFEAIDQWGFLKNERLSSRCSITVTTLHKWCLEQIRNQVEESEIVDLDAMESKEYQYFAIQMAIDKVRKEEFSTWEKFISSQLKEFFLKEEPTHLIEMIQHEISVNIKGRASEDRDKYMKVSSLKHGVPVEGQPDKSFLFRIFSEYRDSFGSSAQFDTDDIVLTAIGQLDTPVWRRRRRQDGYDAIFVDETHLFNINELSVLHFLLKNETSLRIAFSIDRSQAVGDRAVTENDVEFALVGNQGGFGFPYEIKSIFRCSPEIVSLATSITSSGATLFTNFQDPMSGAYSAFTARDEAKSRPPVFCECASDQGMVEVSFEEASSMVKSMECSRSDIAIVAFEPKLFHDLEKFARNRNKPVELLKARGDLEAIRRAEASSSFVLSMADYVGGLEFAGVVLVGVDDGRVPPSSSVLEDSRHFLRYASHNRLYVAVSRAKYQVTVLGHRERGPSSLLKAALHKKILRKRKV